MLIPGITHAVGFNAYDAMAQDGIPTSQDDFCSLIYNSYLQKNPAVLQLIEKEHDASIQQKILMLRTYLKMYRNNEMQGKVSNTDVLFLGASHVNPPSTVNSKL